MARRRRRTRNRTQAWWIRRKLWQALCRSPEYKAFRASVLLRDGHRCVFCGKRRTKSRRIQVHHIKRRSTNPELTLDVNNAVSLCKACHRAVTGNEVEYELFFGNYILGAGLLVKNVA